MRRTTIWMAALATMAITAAAPAITLDGEWNDWFSYGGTSNDNWNQSAASGSLLNTSIRYLDDSDSDAYGGQNYDIEQFFYLYQDSDANAYTGGTLYIGMVTGYEPSNTTYRSGDLFIDLGYTGGPTTYDLAIATGTENGSRFGDVWANTGNWSTSGVTISSHSGSNPYRVRETQPGATYFTNAVVDWDTGNGPGSAHNFLEIALALDGNLEQSIALGGIGFHWTMACGNDNINVYDTNPLSTVPPPPADPDPVPVPVPAPLMLAGMGMALVALRKRRAA
ncbi:MAG: hypothetical protein JNK74_20970 [Candidatus Hydrogenedentes bacterium]|nr:hypothetical protein [Candidatus Hydrogenedentota bacterium]